MVMSLSGVVPLDRSFLPIILRVRMREVLGELGSRGGKSRSNVDLVLTGMNGGIGLENLVLILM